MLSIVTIGNVWSQNTEITPADQPPFNPETLIRNFFIGEGVEILDIKFEGDPEATGFFRNGSRDVGIEQGIVLGTGVVKKIEDPSTDESSTSTSNLDVEDAKLEEIIGADVLKDVASYEITFIPSADSIQFNYVFASEEYPEFVCSVFNDVFGFFITGPNPAGGNYDAQNLAIVPGTSNLPVSINNVNPGVAGSSGTDANCQALANLDFAEFFNFNDSDNLIFDGVLDPFAAAAKVTPCETYTIRFSIADAIDFLKDSAVFLEGKSFSSNALEVKAVTISENGTITEGCAEANLVFELSEITSSPLAISFDVIGSAENGVDIERLESEVVIPAGQSTVALQIIPIEDNLEEDIESLGIVVALNACNTDTLWLGIEDNLLSPPEEQNQVFLCNQNEAQVDYTIPFDPPTPAIFRNQNELRIEPVFTQVFSNIEVQNIFPSTLNQTDFIQVCIDELSHPWIGDLSIYLFGPDNQFVELSQNNGGNGGNGTELDFYLNTCFTLDASQMISSNSVQPPYIGNFLPEGDWNNFFGSSSYKVNGTWRLMMIDNFVGSVGMLSSWSIHFGKSYDINYSWSPNIDISCTDCPNPIFSPDESRIYTLDIEDTNGCSLQYEVSVETDSANIPNPILQCNNQLDNEITVSWEDIDEANSYSIRINGGDWIEISQAVSYTQSNVAPGTSMLFELQAIGSCGNSEIVSTTCSTSSCGLGVTLVSSQDPDCQTPNGGIINVAATGGATPYTYQIGSITNDSGIFENLLSGDHLITVIDVNNCQAQLTVALSSAEDIIIEGTAFMATCMENNGRIEFSVSGGTGELSMEWSDNLVGNLDALAPGTYVLEVTDEAGCLATQEFIVGEEVNFEVTAVVNQPECDGNAFGSINIELNDPSLVDDILWSNGATGTLNEDLEPGTYTVFITSNEGCQFNETYEIEASSNIVVESEIGSILCQGDNSGSILLEIYGGTEPYSIEWSNGMSGNDITGLSEGTYIAEISDDKGCLFTESFDLVEPEPLSISAIQMEPITCNNATAQVELIANGGTPPYSARMNQGSPTSNLIFANLGSGTYSFDVIDSFGCTISTNEVINILPYEEIELITEQFVSVDLGESIQLQALVSNKDESEISFEWFSDNLDILSCIDCDAPVFIGLTTSILEVVATDTNGCSVTSFITINVNSSAEIFVPNVFSPNGDGINDRLSIFGKASLVSSIDEFNIYDRWGNQVSTQIDMIINNQSTGWDGRFKGDPLNNGVFIWSTKVTFIDGSTEVFSGDVTLIR